LFLTLKTLTYTPEQLEEDGWDNTYMKVGSSEVWQTQSERILYDPETMTILQRYVREGRQLYGTIPQRTNGLSKGERNEIGVRNGM
jgi:hypothetical protein